jgi:hypothetical protein
MTVLRGKAPGQGLDPFTAGSIFTGSRPAANAPFEIIIETLQKAETLYKARH